MMSKKRKKAISGILAAVVILFLMTVSANAEETLLVSEAAQRLGDADNSGAISVVDAVCIQRVLAKFQVSPFNELAADVNGNGKIDITDATCIQRYLAKYSVSRAVGAQLRDLYLPTELHCISVGSDHASIRWDAPPEQTDGYEVYVRTPGEDEEDRLLASTQEPCCEVNDLSPATEYILTVRSYRIINQKAVVADDGAELSVTTMSPPVQNLILTLTVDRVYLTWDASPGADGYVIYCDTGEGPELFAETTGTDYRSSSITGNTKYAFYVRTYKNAGGDRIVSPESTSAEGWSSPSMPSFTVTRTKDAYVLKWSKTKGADAYEVMMQALDEEDMRVVALTEELTASVPVGKTAEAMLAVRSVKYADGKEYRGDYCKKLSTQYKETGVIASFGDSIAWGLGSHHFSYTEIIGYRHKLRVDNRSVNAATLSLLQGKHCICDDVLTYVKNNTSYNDILVEGGINDYYNECPLGSVTPDGATGFDRTTVCGALETIFSHIRSTAPSAKTVFVLVHDINDTGVKKNGKGLTFSDYTAGIRAVCAKYGIPIADCSEELKTGDIEMARLYTYTRYGIYPDSDGLHPNEDGYRTFYVPVIEKTLFGE